MNKLLCILGPTASGKTSLGVALAKLFNGEVISADSMQIYRGMDVGTAKPTAEEMDGVVHHMLDICDISESYSVARYVREADACAVDIISRGKLPIVVGGTGLYVDALINGREFSAYNEDSEFRQQLEIQAEKDGIDSVREILKKHDPASYERLHPNDKKRIIRAAEVWLSTGKTITQHDRETGALPPKYDAIKIGLNFENRSELYARIDKRVDIMLDNGLVDEVRRLLDSGHTGTALQAIGYKEFSEYLGGKMSLEEACEAVKQGSRRYAKRQLTWLRRDDSIHWITMNEPVDFDSVVQDACSYIRRNL
ncbi:MAG: tRNA (adenosine(37)-N6)-dimethylallyltransferase MiaA [Ruminococcaceae bacterium]|nr:tRNA (adenosine(37)-N6)-dimethylallyltransferase MiaA [Oscillospiraceae bacterium]